MATTEVVLQQGQALARVSSEDFMPVFDMKTAIARRAFLVEIVKSEVMVPDVDYGRIPGTEKPTLLKPGAEKLCTLFGLSPEFVLEHVIEDWTGADHGGEPLFYYRYKCRLTKNGFLIGEGIASCNSWESKYRYRWVNEDQVPPHLSKDSLPKRTAELVEPLFAINKAETAGKYGKPKEYWDRFKAAMEDGTARQTTRKKADGGEMPAIAIGGTVYRVPNQESPDVVNTCQKMAQKRSLVASVLIGTNASEFFSQDLEDFDYIGGHAPAAATAPVETQEQVAERRLAEERAKAAEAEARAKQQQQQKPAAAPAKAAPAAEAPIPDWAKHVPDEVSATWARMGTTRKAIVAEFDAELSRMIRAFGNDRGREYYAMVLEEHGKFDPLGFSGSISQPRRILLELYKVRQLEAERKAKLESATLETPADKVAAEGQQITDEDLPGELFGDPSLSK